jgi:hypothetical protein
MGIAECYVCDLPDCDKAAPTHEVTYRGRFPKGWIVVRISVWPQVSDATANALAFCSTECFEAWRHSSPTLEDQ